LFGCNINGTQNILDLCEIYKIRLLFASTCCCYGNVNEHPSNEDSQIYPCEPYAKSKALCEELILKSKLPHVSMRLATFYGPNMRKELAPAIFLHNAHYNLKISIHGDGKQTRTFTYIDDIVSGILTILQSNTPHKIINITGTEIISVLNMISIIEEIMGKKCIIEFVKDRDGQIYKEDISNTRLKELGWEPKTSFKEGMKLSYNYFLSKKIF
jgi:nucleoside-diphosphate-sugar epimerase